MRFYMRISVIVISVSKLAIKLYQNLLLISFFIFLFFSFLREELCLSLIGRDWGSVDGQFVMYYIKRLYWRSPAGRACTL